MNYFLLFVIVAICGGGYYEYKLQQQNDAGYQQQLGDLEAKIDKLQSDNTKIGNEKTALSKDLADAQKKVSDLTSQIETAAAAAKAVKDAEDAEKAAKAAVLAATAQAKTEASSNNLGTVTTLNGKTFQNCQLLRVETDGITFNHSSGIAKVLFPLLAPDVQKKFGYDPHNGPDITDAQVQSLEAQRQAASKATGN